MRVMCVEIYRNRDIDIRDVAVTACLFIFIFLLLLKLYQLE